MRKLKQKTVSLLCALAVMLLISSIVSMNRGVAGLYTYEHVHLGDVSLKVYVVCLDGVGAHGVGNVNRTVEGAFDASLLNVSTWDMGLFGEVIKIGEVAMNTSFIIIRDWSTFREVVESGSNAIIVNAHGETVPVPSGYSKEQWVDRIADAMVTRNVTWVHTAMYPFYYAWQENGSQELWGEDGFKRLMSHIGLPNATCMNYLQSEFEDLTGGGRMYLLYSWDSLSAATKAQRGRPLRTSDFRNFTVLPIWGPEDEYMTGAVIKFANASGASDSGFYVHIGTNQTFNGYRVPTDADFYRGYAGAAAALWTNAWYLSAKHAISEAESAISKAESEGRTKGLDSARTLLQKAKMWIGKFWLTDSNEEAREARIAAENATQPSPKDYTLPLTLLGVGIAATSSSLLVVWKKNSKKKENKTR